MANDVQGDYGLKHRKTTLNSSFPSSSQAESEEKLKAEDETVWGKTPSGTVFRVPTTHDVLTSLFHPLSPKSHLDILTLALLVVQIALFVCLPIHVSRTLFLVYFFFWRSAYDGGLGYVLTLQSKRRWIVKEVQKHGWMDNERKPAVREWICKQLAGKMGTDYSFDNLPIEYNTWLLFRQIVDIILLNDFVSYCMFAFAHFRVPTGLSFPMHLLRWICGVALIAFNLWVKTEAHHVVKDYGWYWGDVFFARGALVFDGVFEMAPHPMYSVGYAGYYGLSMIVGSYTVLFVSLAAHAAQFGFLMYFENPHIERTYGQKKLLAQRIPLPSSRIERKAQPSIVPPLVSDTTPDISEGETGESDLESEDLDNLALRPTPSRPKASLIKTDSELQDKAFTQHDLLSRYFHSDTVVLFNMDLLRAPDFTLAILLSYIFFSAITPTFSESASLTVHFLHALAWRVFHSFVLGFLLRAQSERKWIVRHFIKHYHFPGEEGTRRAIEEAFGNWKAIYNLSLCLTYASFAALAWKTYHTPIQWTVGGELLRHTLGLLLLGLHVWSANQSFKVLGLFGWFFGDFFIEDYPTQLVYTGIYRFLNNPEISMSGAAVWGLSLISGSKLVLSLAVISHLSHWWFLRYVERPHMRKLYGDSLRKEAGFTRTIKNAASKNARLLEVRAGRHAPEIRKVAQEVKGTFDKVFEETADALEDFIARSQPKISEVMQETKVLLQQSRERLIITRVTSDLSSYDTTKYSLKLVPPCPGRELRWHLGEPIKVRWKAPPNHSRRDWIGIYRLGSNKSRVVSNLSSQGHWKPIVDEEWDGDIALYNETLDSVTEESGELTFDGTGLPWQVGQYEMRYHHDGRHNVMAISDPIEIYVDRPAVFDYGTVHEHLARMVVLCLDSDPDLVPACTLPASEQIEESAVDPEDFRFYSEEQAARIAKAIKEAFGAEYTPDVIMADAKLSSLTKKILVSRDLLAPFHNGPKVGSGCRVVTD